MASDRRNSFEAEALPHMDALYGTALRLTKDERDAEDLVQETYLRAYTFFDRFRAGTNCRAWMFKILHNSFINRYRRKVRERQAYEKQVHGPLYDNFVSSATIVHHRQPDRGVMNSVLSDDVAQALDELPEEFRLPVVLADLQDFSYKEIAAILDCPVGTVMSRLFRGRRQLRSRLLQHAVDQGIVSAARVAAELEQEQGSGRARELDSKRAARAS